MPESRVTVPMTIRDFFFEDPFFKSTWEDFDKIREKMFQESEERWKRFDEDFKNMACMSSNSSELLNRSLKDKNESLAKSIGSAERKSSLKSSESKVVRSRMSSSSERKMSSSSERKMSSEKDLKKTNSSEVNKNINALDNWMNDEDDSFPFSRIFPRKWMLPGLDNIFKDLKDMNLFQDTKDSEVIRMKEDDSKMEVSLDTSNYKPDELSVSVANNAVTIEGKHEEKAEDGSKMVARQFVRKYTLPRDTRPEDVLSNLSSDGVLVITANKKNPKAIDVKINKN